MRRMSEALPRTAYRVQGQDVLPELLDKAAECFVATGDEAVTLGEESTWTLSDYVPSVPCYDSLVQAWRNR